MKIKDIVKEMTLGSIDKVDNATGKVEINTQSGQKQTVDASQLTTGPDGKPTIKMPQTGSQVNVQTAEDQPTGNTGFQPANSGNTYFVNTKVNPPQVKVSGNATVPLNKASAEITPELAAKSTDWSFCYVNVNGTVYPALATHREVRVGPSAFASITGMHEEHRDTIAQGGGDIGGDATDRFNKEVTGSFDRVQRGKLSENDELQKWLTIAGIK